jgi:hypothetical protein
MRQMVKREFNLTKQRRTELLRVYDQSTTSDVQRRVRLSVCMVEAACRDR